MPRLAVLFLAPVLAFVALMAWGLSSPVGASPDDDFHLVSIWCASPSHDDYCKPGTTATERVVPKALVMSSCYAFDSDKSASCQRSLDFRATPNTLTQRGNFVGGYPPVYYATMGLLAGHDIVFSVLAMRALNILLFVALATGIYLLLPRARRPALVWSWLITTVPLGMFVLSSNNPSAWAVTGVGLGWIALLGYFETTGWKRKAGLGALFAVAAVMAAGSRGDAAIYTLLGIAAVAILTFARTRKYALEAILPVVVAVFCLAIFRVSRPVASVTEGITGGAGGGATAPPSDILGSFAFNLLQGPSLWTGIFGQDWGLGWLDTSMPAVVWFGGIACFVSAGFVAVGRLSGRKLVVLVLGTLVLWLLPTIVLVSAGDTVGENMQPRYLLPLIVLFAGVLMLAPGIRAIRFGRLQRTLIAVTLSVTQLIALHLNIQRYVTGFDNLGWNLDSGIEWWWNMPISPMVVWIIGSAAFGALVFILLGRHSGAQPLAGSDALNRPRAMKETAP